MDGSACETPSCSFPIPMYLRKNILPSNLIKVSFEYKKGPTPFLYSLKQMASISSRQPWAMLLTSTDTCRMVFTHERRVHFVECGKIVHVGDTNTVVLAMSVTARPAAFEHGLHVRQRLDGLFFHAVADDFPGNG